MFQPSQRQLAIFTTWQSEDSNILINAVAGSGKTTTLLQLLRYCNEKTLFLAFNKSIQEEISKRIEENNLKQGKALTIHSLGLRAIRKTYKRVDVGKGKNFKLIKQLQKDYLFSDFFNRLTWEDKLKISYHIMDMNDVSRLFLTDDINEIIQHLRGMDKDIENFPGLGDIWNRFITLREGSYEGDRISVDFIDMIYLPIHKKLNIPIDPTYLMIDEAQDLNLAQHIFVDQLIAQGDVKKWIAVGDRNQAIYGFSGASSSSFDMFLNKPGIVKEMPLDICYRCSTNIIDVANEVYPVMQYSSDNEGIVDTVTDIAKIKDNSMVVCRNSNPIISLYFSLLGQDRRVFIKGTDILTSLLRFLKPYKTFTVDGAKYEMLMKEAELTQSSSERDKFSLYIFKQDFENFKKLADNLVESWDSIDTLLTKINSLFVDQEDAIMLCTIHKSKGLESDVVYILKENLIPSKWAKSPEQLRQENNLKYVARTRAKNELYFLNI